MLFCVKQLLLQPIIVAIDTSREIPLHLSPQKLKGFCVAMSLVVVSPKELYPKKQAALSNDLLKKLDQLFAPFRKNKVFFLDENNSFI